MNSVFYMMQKGGPVMIPLVILSVLALASFIERMLYWFFMRGSGASSEELRASLETGCGVSEPALDKDPLARMFFDKNGILPREHFRKQKKILETELNRSLTLMDTVVTAAPLLGIFGTVTGIIRSFNILSKDVSLPSPEVLTSGIAEALITTAAGLAVAIPTLIAFNIFSQKAAKLNLKFEEIKTEAEKAG